MLVLCLLFIPFIIIAQENEENYFGEEIVVTATRTEIPHWSVARSMSLITAKDIEMQRRLSVTDILSSVSGLDVTQNGGIVLTTLDDRILSEITRLLEARYFTGKTEINELITLEDFGILCLHAVNTSLISVIQFKRECPFETALIISKKFSKRIKTTL